MNHVDAMLDATFWGIHRSSHAAFLRRPLPVTDEFPTQTREIRCPGGLTEIDLPPYIAAYPGKNRTVEVMLCTGNGWRANWDPTRKDQDGWIYINGPNVPEEWETTIEAVLKEIRLRWPRRQLVFHPDDHPAPWE